MGKKKRTALAPETASLLRRAGAFLIDWYVGALATALPIAAIAMQLGRDMTDQNIVAYEGSWGLIAGLLGILFGIAYYAGAPLLMRGQTLGKRVCGVRIVAKDGSEASPLALLGRQVLGLMLIEGASVGTSTVVWQVFHIVTGVDVLVNAMAVGTVVTLASIAVAGLGTGHRAIHDMVFGTMVTAA